MAATTLSKIVTIEQGVRPDAESFWRSIRGLIVKEPLLTGTSITFEPTEGNLPQPAKVDRIQLNISEVLAEMQRRMTRWFDVTLTKDSGNTGTDGARADVIVDGQVIVANAPATFLLFLEKRLAELHADLRRIPVQSAAEDWESSTEPGVWRTEAVRVPTTKKDTEFRTVSPAEGMRPAQYEPVSHDVLSGYRTTVKFTSAPTATWLTGVLKRVTALREAVQMAVHEANTKQIQDQKAGGAIFGFIFANGSE